jgi:hydroxypyruvate reductase/glycerate 2-kinase
MDHAVSNEQEPDRSGEPPVAAAGPATELQPASIGNREALSGHGLTASRSLALRVAEAGLVACDPGLAVERLVQLDGDELIVDDSRHRLHPEGRILVLGSGKASLKIALALERILGDRVHGGTVVVRHGSAAAVPRRIELLEASHPLPDERSVAAALWLLEQAGELGEHDLVIACFTGGSSALTSLPPAGVTPAEKRDLHRLLLGAGLPISEVNTVRKQVSGFKGGRLALAVAPARLINLTVSDVAGDPLDAITDPSVANDSTVADASSILRSHDLWGEVSGSIRRHLEDPRLAVPDLSGMEIHTTLLVTGETACEAMAAEARAAGANPVIISTGLEEEATSVGRILGQLAFESAELGRPFNRPSVLIGCGGESTVRLGPEHEFGSGGPNQEAALAAAGRFAGADVSSVFIDTDGSDGSTDLAGAISDGATAERAREAGIDLRDALARHRTGEALAALDDGIETGPTHTNVNDLFAIAIGGADL